MKILLINPPYFTFTSIVGVGHQIPLGLLMVGGPLIDAGHEVRLLDAEQRHSSITSIIDEVGRLRPEIVMTGHSGSTPAHTVCVSMLRSIKNAYPEIITAYGGVYPSYHAEKILKEEPAIDYVIRGEGEATALELVETLRDRDSHSTSPVLDLPGISYRPNGMVRHNPDRVPIQDLGHYRAGWELIENWDHYQIFGLGRTAIVQFSRGCPHRCTYCGQHGFWVTWRHRDPIQFVDEIEKLHRIHGINFFTLADENPTTLKATWQKVLEEIASRNLPIYFFATIRATDIVRDADILPLYRRAGILYVLMGIETTNPKVIKEIHKGSTTQYDYLACQLLKKHGIYSILGHIVGLEEDSWTSLLRSSERLKEYDGDYLNAMYVTPHSWTRFAQDIKERRIVQEDQSKWDYRHQILEQHFLKPWQLFAMVKWLELRFQFGTGGLSRLLRPKDGFDRHQRWWTTFHIGLVWLAEIMEFIFATAFVKSPRKLLDVDLDLNLPSAPAGLQPSTQKAE